MAPASGRMVWPKPGRCLTIDTGEMLVSIAAAEWRSCVSSQDSKAGSCRLDALDFMLPVARDAGC